MAVTLLIAGNAAPAQADELGMPFLTPDANVTIPHDPRLEPSYTGAFTISLWYKPMGILNNPLPRLWGKGANYVAVMGNYDGGLNSEHHRVALEVSNGTSASEFWARPTRLVDGTWYHIVISFDQNNCLPTMLINDVVQTVKERYPWCAKTNRVMKTNSKPVMIGNRTSYYREAEGYIREVAYYDRVLTQAETSAIHAGLYPSQNLVYHLPMCNVDCLEVPDISGNGYHGTKNKLVWAMPQ